MLRLTRTTQLPHEVVLKAEGQIVAEWVELLEEECLQLVGPERRVLLDLADVSYLDRRAVRLIRELVTGAVAIINCPPLVEELLREDPS
jgi:anti-anti-sigma regulatory factor